MTQCRGTKVDSVVKGSFRWVFRIVVVICALVRGCFSQNQNQQQQLQQQADMNQRIAELYNEFQENPRDADARFNLAWASLIANGIQPHTKDLLKSAFNPYEVDVPLYQNRPYKSFLAAHLIGRYAKELRDSKESQIFLHLAYDISRHKLFPDKGIGDICTHLQLATDLTFYPTSNQEVDESVANVEKWANKLIDLISVQKHQDAHIDVEWLGKSMPGFNRDPYNHCILSLFPLSFYYRADVARIANLFYQMAILAFPKLMYTAQHVKDFDAAQALARAETNNSSTSIVQSCVDRKIRLGVVSSTLSEGHSVSDDFGGVLQRLDRELFDVSYHYVHEKYMGEDAAFLTANPTDTLYHYHQSDTEVLDGAWLRRIGKELEEFRFDMILYLDLTMSTYARRLGMERLAPVQINTHGHPITSGIPRDTMQHFVSWAEAELPLEASQSHYTEELQLIPKGKIHQYYSPRLGKDPEGGRISLVTNFPINHLTRHDFDELPENIRNSSPRDENIHLYICMQQPFKVFPEFDELVCGVLQGDPHGHAILLKEEGHAEIFVQRLTAAGCDMERVHFIPPQPHHRLMALYQLSTVILDSYPAGGCTTSREALELGKAIVTWPARLLGGRWTLGLYKAIGLDESAQDKVISSSKEEYIAKAVALGANKSLREGVETKILEALPNLFGREEAVEEWESILLRVSPVKRCGDVNDSKEEDDALANGEL